MKTNLRITVLVTSAVIVFTLAAAAQTYTITDLGTLGTNASFATGVNNSN